MKSEHRRYTVSNSHHRQLHRRYCQYRQYSVSAPSCVIRLRRHVSLASPSCVIFLSSLSCHPLHRRRLARHPPAVVPASPRQYVRCLRRCRCPPCPPLPSSARRRRHPSTGHPHHHRPPAITPPLRPAIHGGNISYIPNAATVHPAWPQRHPSVARPSPVNRPPIPAALAQPKCPSNCVAYSWHCRCPPR